MGKVLKCEDVDTGASAMLGKVAPDVEMYTQPDGMLMTSMVVNSECTELPSERNTNATVSKHN